MTLLLDPSMLVGARARTWLLRAQRSGALHQVSMPASIYLADADDLRPRGLFAGHRAPLHLDLLHDVQHVAYRGEQLPRAAHDGPSLPALARDTWSALIGGATLVARRTDVLDHLLAAGVVLHVRSCKAQQGVERHLLAHAWPQAPAELTEALSRRARLLARTVEHCSTPEDLIIEVWDKGPYGTGSWR